MPIIKDTGTCQEEDIRRRAYEIYLERTSENAPGDDKQDWLEAERELNVKAKLYRALS